MKLRVEFRISKYSYCLFGTIRELKQTKLINKELMGGFTWLLLFGEVRV